MAVMIPEGRASLWSFLLGASVIIVGIIGTVNTVVEYVLEDWLILVVLLYSVIINVLVLIIYRPSTTLYQVAVRGTFLGSTLGCGILVSFYTDTWQHFGWYLTALSFFHWSEYFVTAVTNPSSLQLDSYMLDHSTEYKIAAAASWMEFTIEWWLFPGMKQIWWLSTFGLFIVIGGEVLRKLAMFTARSNFNHFVQYVKEEGHTLVTHGIYSIFRHPSYVGWFWWSIGTQIILCNPVCLVGYAITSWKFFKNRIEGEEITLLNFFGEEYLDYQRRVPTGLPGIQGYKVEL